MADIPIIDWEFKYSGSKYPNKLDWTDVLDGDTINTVDVTLVEGDVVLNDPAPTSFSGVLQTIFLSAGTAGPQVLLAYMKTTDLREFYQLIRFEVIETP